jgi:hypothetical protein
MKINKGSPGEIKCAIITQEAGSSALLDMPKQGVVLVKSKKVIKVNSEEEKATPRFYQAMERETCLIKKAKR